MVSHSTSFGRVCLHFYGGYGALDLRVQGENQKIPLKEKKLGVFTPSFNLLVTSSIIAIFTYPTWTMSLFNRKSSNG